MGLPGMRGPPGVDGMRGESGDVGVEGEQGPRGDQVCIVLILYMSSFVIPFSFISLLFCILVSFLIDFFPIRVIQGRLVLRVP